MKHPNIDEKQFYAKINEIYKSFKVPKKRLTFEQICMPKEYVLQLPQQFLAKFFQYCPLNYH